MKTTLNLRRRTAFHLDRPQFPARDREEKVHLGSIGGSIVVRLGSIRRRSDQRFDDKALPGLSDDRMTEQSFLVPNTEQSMRDATIAHIHLGGLDQPLAGIPVPGRQSSNKQEVNKKIKIAGYRFAIDGQAARQSGGIQNLSLVVGQHRPEAAKCLSRYARPELGDVALQVRSDKITPPLQAEIVRLCQETARKATPDPECIDHNGVDLQGVERTEFQIGDTPRQTLAGLLEQVHGG